MPSHLSRLVIRRLLSNEPITSRACVFRSSRCRLIRSSYANAHYNGNIQRRTFFGWGTKPPPRAVKQPSVAPGIAKLSELSRMALLKSHPPKPAELVQALEALVKHKNETQEPLQDFEVIKVRENLEHLQQLPPKEDVNPWISSGLLHSTLHALQRVPNDKKQDHLSLAKYILEALEKLGEAGKDSQEIVLLLMTAFGETSQARDKLVQLIRSHVSGPQPSCMYLETGLAILDTYARESNEQEVIRTIEIFHELEFTVHERFTNAVVSAVAMVGNRERAKFYYEDAIARDVAITPQTTSVIVKHCAQKMDHEWSLETVRKLASKEHVKRPDWDSIFLWAAAMGKGVDDVERMMQVMMSRTHGTFKPTVETINMLVELCHFWHDSYTAERFVTLGEKFGIQPNTTTYILQMNYRLSVDDIGGAIAAYKKFRTQNTDEIKDNEDGPTVNRLLKTMISSGKYSNNSIMAVVDDLSERHVRFEPETVATLCKFHIHNEEFHDTIDLLATHTNSYSLEERTKVADTFVEICLDPKTSAPRAWDTYSIFSATFKETPRSKREAVMQSFFWRHRADMAVHVFNDFKRHENPSIRANTETYVKAFVGVGEVGNVDSFDAIHNNMKVDTNIDLTTRLLNAIMLACIGCEMPREALRFWDQIFRSKDGPNYNSIMIAFRACEKAPFGYETSMPLWERLLKLKIEISRELFASYVGALAGNAMVDEAIHLVESGRKDFGFEPDVLTLGTMFNATSGFWKQEQVEKYIRRTHYNVWAQLEKIGIHETPWKVKSVKMDRTLTP